MSEASQTCDQGTSTDMNNATFSQESEDGHTLCDSLAGPMTARSGLVHVPVSRFRALDTEKALTTNDTSGPLFTHSSPSTDLQSFLENKLRERMDLNGSLEYVLTWKTSDMPSGPPICALLASARRTGDIVYIGWPTPRVGGGGKTGKKYKGRLEDAAVLASGMTQEQYLIRYRKIDIGVLNLDLARWLQGFPDIWSNCAPTVMQSSRKSRRNSYQHTCAE